MRKQGVDLRDLAFALAAEVSAEAVRGLYEALDEMTAAFRRRTPLSTEAANRLLARCESALARARGEE